MAGSHFWIINKEPVKTRQLLENLPRFWPPRLEKRFLCDGVWQYPARLRAGSTGRPRGRAWEGMVGCRVWGHRQRREGGSCGGRDENGRLLEKVVVEDAEEKAAVNHNPPPRGGGVSAGAKVAYLGCGPPLGGRGCMP